MRKTSIVFLLFLTITALLFRSGSIRAADSTQDSIPTPTQDQQAVDQIAYTLPYPGILPDHPLYPLKKVRDWILNFLIKDPMKRAEFNLLMSDKRYAMGPLLAEKENYKQAAAIVEEAEDYYANISDELEALKMQNREIRTDQIEKILAAADKHRDVIADMKKRVPEDTKVRLDSVEETISSNAQKIASYGN